MTLLLLENLQKNPFLVQNVDKSLGPNPKSMSLVPGLKSESKPLAQNPKPQVRVPIKKKPFPPENGEE